MTTTYWILNKPKEAHSLLIQQTTRLDTLPQSQE